MSNQVEVAITHSPQVTVEIQQDSTTVEANASMPQQPVAAVLIDAATAGAIYVGLASYGTTESAAAWTITRSLYSAAGVRTSKGTATAVTWTGRSSHTYT
jgi:hypothetical protein